MALGTMNTDLKTTFSLIAGTAVKGSFFDQLVSDVNTEYTCSRFTIASGAADTELDFGHLASCDAVIIVASEAIDNIFLSTVIGGHTIAVGQPFFEMHGLSNVTTIHLDCTGSGADVDIQYMLISNE